MTFTRAALALALTLACGHAWATSTPFTLTTSWQKISTAGVVDVSGQVFLTTSGISGGGSGQTSPAPSNSSPGLYLAPGEHRCFALPAADLYAKTGWPGSVVVMDGILCGQ